MQEAMTVTELNNYARRLLENDVLTQMVNVSGEVSNFKRHSSGHIYFVLKDQTGSVACSFLKNYNTNLKFDLADGMQVTVTATATVYERDGRFQLLVYKVKQNGTGLLYEQLTQLKEKLAKEGLFDREELSINPPYPRRIAVLTSPTGAAVQDILNVTGRRAPNIELVIVPVPVQGAGAGPQIAKALRYTELYLHPDVIILARGGGPIEDLWCFNDETLVRTIAACRIPIISGVGHEIDFTLCDFAANYRAPTPSAAAEKATPDTRAILAGLESTYAAICRSCQRELGLAAQQIESAMSAITAAAPQQKILHQQKQAALLYTAIRTAAENRVAALGTALDRQMETLTALDPFRVLSRGYAILSKDGTSGLTDIGAVQPGESVQVRLENGTLDCRVEEIHPLP